MTTSRSRIADSLVFFSGLGVALPALFLYWLTSYPTIAYIDSGELAVVNWTLGIAHPTGYPLYTLLGRLFSLLPFELIKTQIWFGMLATAAAVVIVTLIADRLQSAGSKSPETRHTWPALIIVCLGLLLAVSPLLWAQGVTNEVYSLHLLFLTLFLFVISRPYSDRNLIVGGYLLGLSFGNHMSTILLFPTVIAYLIVNRAAIFRSPRFIAAAIAAGLCAGSVYLYLPIRSSLDPILNWGHPYTWENFVRHVSGWQYQVWMFDRGAAELWQQFIRFGKILLTQFPLPFWALVIIGFGHSFKRNKAISLYLILLLTSNLIYSLNFSIPDIDNYLLPSVIVLFLFGAIGTLWLMSLKRSGARIVCGAITVLVLWGAISNWGAHDESKNFAAYDGIQNYYKSVEQSALIISADWDFVSPWLYSHFCLKERPDVTIVDPELMRRSWYPDVIRHADFTLYTYLKPQIDAFLPHVRLFEQNLPYDGGAIEAAYRAMLFKLATHPTRPVYLSSQDAGISQQLAAAPDFAVVPSGQLWRVARPGETIPRPADRTVSPRFGKAESSLDGRDRLHMEDFNRMRQIDSAFVAKNKLPAH